MEIIEKLKTVFHRLGVHLIEIDIADNKVRIATRTKGDALIVSGYLQKGGFPPPSIRSVKNVLWIVTGV